MFHPYFGRDSCCALAACAAALAVPFIVTLIHSDATIEMRTRSGFRLFNSEGKESDFTTRTGTRGISIGTKAVQTLGKPSIDSLIKSLDSPDALEPVTDVLCQITGQDFGTDISKWKV